MNNMSFICLDCVNVQHAALVSMQDVVNQESPILGCCDCAACEKDIDVSLCPVSVFTDADFDKYADLISGYVYEPVVIDPFEEYDHQEWIRQHPLYQPTMDWEFNENEDQVFLDETMFEG